MGDNDDRHFWPDLLGCIEEQTLVPVVGPDLIVVNVGNVEQTFSSLIGQRLAKEYELSTWAEMATMGQAVEAILQDPDRRDEVERLYRAIKRNINNIHPVPGDALRDLAEISDLRLFVSTTPDQLLTRALNEVRFQGRSGTYEQTFSLTEATSEQALNAQRPAPTDTVVLNLFGGAASTAQFAIHEEDRLEWLHALVSDAARLPEWLFRQLKHQSMLFIGCEIPDWIGRFLLRLSSTARLSDERDKQFFFVGSSTAHVPSLKDFFATYCRKPLVQQLEMEPTAFVAELRERWAKRNPGRQTPGPRPGARADFAGPRVPATPSIFISYMREDLEAARRLHTAIARLGGEAWLDERRLNPGGEWEKEILTAIGETVRLFVPVISANTEREREGYVFREWAEAAERSRKISSGRFIVPVIIDEDYDGDLSRYPKGRDYFERLQFGRAPAGDPDAVLIEILAQEIER